MGKKVRAVLHETRHMLDEMFSTLRSNADKDNNVTIHNVTLYIDSWMKEFNEIEKDVSMESENDYTIMHNSYMIRAERMNKNLWWWSIYKDNLVVVDVYTEDYWPRTKKETFSIITKALRRILDNETLKVTPGGINFGSV